MQTVAPGGEGSLCVFDQCITEYGIHSVEYYMLTRTVFAAKTILPIIENIEFCNKFE